MAGDTRCSDVVYDAYDGMNPAMGLLDVDDRPCFVLAFSSNRLQTYHDRHIAPDGPGTLGHVSLVARRDTYRTIYVMFLEAERCSRDGGPDTQCQCSIQRQR